MLVRLPTIVRLAGDFLDRTTVPFAFDLSAWPFRWPFRWPLAVPLGLLFLGVLTRPLLEAAIAAGLWTGSAVCCAATGIARVQAVVSGGEDVATASAAEVLAEDG